MPRPATTMAAAVRRCYAMEPMKRATRAVSMGPTATAMTSALATGISVMATMKASKHRASTGPTATARGPHAMANIAPAQPEAD